MAEFNESYTRGRQVEEMVLNLIKPKYPKAFIQEGYFKEWDIFIPEKDFGIEVKCDEMSKYTGNFVVEVEMDGKPSALSTTKAIYWVFFDGNEFIWIETEKIKDIVLHYPISEFTGKGDTKPKKAHLVKKYEIIENAIHRKKYEKGVA